MYKFWMETSLFSTTRPRGTQRLYVEPQWSKSWFQQEINIYTKLIFFYHHLQLKKKTTYILFIFCTCTAEAASEMASCTLHTCSSLSAEYDIFFIRVSVSKWHMLTRDTMWSVVSHMRTAGSSTHKNMQYSWKLLHSKCKSWAVIICKIIISYSSLKWEVQWAVFTD